MFSAIVLCPASTPATAVVRTLAALVPLAVGGLVRDLVMAAPAEPVFSRIADEAGCALSGSTEFAVALALTRADWLLVIRAGFAPLEGFNDEAGDFLGGGARAGLLRAEPAALWTRLFPATAEIAGLLVPRSMLGKAATGSLANLPPGLQPRVTLRTRARRVL